MRLLAIDTSLGACSACILDTAEPDRAMGESILMARGHAEALMPMLARIAAASSPAPAHGGLPAVDRIAVTIGPGSYTGLRVGVSAARAIGLALDVPVVGVTTLAALAAPLIGREAGRLITAAIDARHGSVYVTVLNADGRAVIPPRLASLKDAARAIGAGPSTLVGSGARLVAHEAWAMGLDVTVAEGGEAPQAGWVARLGALSAPPSNPPRPLYLRAPETTPQDGARIARL